MLVSELFSHLGLATDNPGACAIRWIETNGPTLESLTPDTGAVLGTVRQALRPDYERVVAESCHIFPRWQMMPAPKRGEIVREIADALRAAKPWLGALVTMEMGKILAEGEGEVQEMIDIADFAVGLSRQLYGKTMHSERPGHRMYEHWHPLGPVGVITAFNFPVAVWAWNALVAAVCGNTVIWKPSPQTPLTALAVQHLVNRVMTRHGLDGVFSLVIGSNEEIGEAMVHDRRLPLLSFTGSTEVGRHVAQGVAARLGRSLLELGGNNGLIVMDDADLELALRATVFGAIGTAGQRCTSTRRLFLQQGIAAEFIENLRRIYGQIRIGNPMEPETLMGPLVSEAAVGRMLGALDEITAQGGQVIRGGNHLGGAFAEPTLVFAPGDLAAMRSELFAPVLYITEFETLAEVLSRHNAVPQGLSSAIFTRNLTTAEIFLSHIGSDCGIANVNLGTSGAEIGGAFGGEKETGGGREAGSDSWKAYMRRQTTTINWSGALPLAQGIRFL